MLSNQQLCDLKKKKEALDLKHGNPEYKSCSDHQLDLLQVVSRLTPRPHLLIAKWSASYQLVRFLTRESHYINY